MSVGTLVWKDDSHLTVNDMTFYVTYQHEELIGIDSTTTRFLLGKSRSMIEKVLTALGGKTITHILDIGIFKGGSVVLYDQLFRPAKIVAVEFVSEPNKALAQYIQTHRRESEVKPYYGVNQADRRAMQKILSSEFLSAGIDLIVDDASHLYAETRETFNLSFPYLRPGGHYVIEDWAWAHWPGEYWQENNSYFGSKPALTNLLIELMMLAASRSDLIADISVNHNMIIVTRGASPLSPGSFDIGEHYLLRGKQFQAWL